MALVFDIETVGENFDELDQTTRDNLTHWIKRESLDDGERYNSLLLDLKNGLGFSPLTGAIVALGVYDTELHQGVVYFLAPDVELKDYRVENFVFKPRTEAEMLEAFWEGIAKYKEVVSFNGHAFDLPFLMLRSAINKVKPSCNLMSSRYLNRQDRKIKHIDLLDQLSFYGAVRRKGSLHLYCRAFGIKSPKAQGITGDEVQRLYNERRYQEIAEYNSWDLIATAELHKIWQEYFFV